MAIGQVGMGFGSTQPHVAPYWTSHKPQATPTLPASFNDENLDPTHRKPATNHTLSATFLKIPIKLFLNLIYITITLYLNKKKFNKLKDLFKEDLLYNK